jgi:hypothetical protein
MYGEEVFLGLADVQRKNRVCINYSIALNFKYRVETKMSVIISENENFLSSLGIWTVDENANTV